MAVTSATRKPMSKDTSTLNILTCENYIRSRLGRVIYEHLFQGIIGNHDFLITHEHLGRLLPVSTEFLLKPHNWISNRLLHAVYLNTTSILRDPQAIYKAGRSIFKTAVASQVALMRLLGVRAIINRLPLENAKFNRNRTLEVVQNRGGLAIVRIHWHKDPYLTKLNCDMTRGVFEGLGRLTHNIAEVSEHCCQMGGGAYCEYHIKWKPKAFYSRWMDLLRYHVSHEAVDELEHKIEEINDIRLKQEKIIAQRTKELEKQRRTVLRAHRILSSYVPAQLSRKVIAGEVAPIWGHRRSKLSMFFSDIKDFTAFIEITEPEDMAVLLNEYFVCMNAVIDRYGGTLANINGDGLFVFFGAPDQTGDKDHALRCVGMAVHMQRKMQKLQKKWFEAGVERTLQIRCGINTGMATVGGFGSSERKNYTAMGKHVNLASRLESACPPGSVLISHSTWALVKDRIRCEPRGQIRVKGFTSPVRVYEVRIKDHGLRIKRSSARNAMGKSYTEKMPKMI